MLNNPSKNEIFTATAALISKKGFTIIKKDLHRPWGGFFVIEEAQAAMFVKEFFPEEDLESIQLTEKLSPKILMVAPGKRLSWQYHHRRAELWKCLEGKVAVVTSHTDQEDLKHILKPGDKIKLKQGERHRLIGLKTWGVVAEIWQHTDPDNPSDEDDIIRLQDDFGR
jgi:mannose-6-phosphate isomerase-like protein (cupin superfamily)